MFERANVSYFRRTELLISNTIESSKFQLSADLVKDSEGDRVYVYEPDRPEDALLLMAMVSILLKNFVMRSASMPKRLTKITQLREYHYEFMNNQADVESVHRIILEPIYFEKNKMGEYVNDIFYRKAMLTVLLRHYINIPMYNTHSKNSLNCEHAPPLGDIHTCLNHIVIQYLFDKPFARNYPEIVFTRYGHEVFILNHVSSVNQITQKEIPDFVEKLEGISGHVNSIYRIDETEPQK